MSKTDHYPILPLRGIVPFPFGPPVPLQIGKLSSVALIRAVQSSGLANSPIIAITLQPDKEPSLDLSSFEKFGVGGIFISVEEITLGDGQPGLRVEFEPRQLARLESVSRVGDYFVGTAQFRERSITNSKNPDGRSNLSEVFPEARKLIERWAAYAEKTKCVQAPYVAATVHSVIADTIYLQELIDVAAFFTCLSSSQKSKLLEECDSIKQLEMLTDHVAEVLDGSAKM